MTWTSMWRGLVAYGSMNNVPSPKAASASRCADSTAPASDPRSSTTLMPRPPPPADAFTRSGKPTPFTRSARSPPLWPAISPAVISIVGSKGTPAAAIVDFAASFEPICSITSAGGPTNVSPAPAQALANEAFSDRNP